MKTSLMVGFATLALGSVAAAVADKTAAEGKTFTDKTLVVWASPANLEQSGGSALTIDDLNGGFDGIVFAEIKPRAWAPGSDNFNRAPNNKDSLPPEAGSSGQFVQIAITYQGASVIGCWSGKCQ